MGLIRWKRGSVRLPSWKLPQLQGDKINTLLFTHTILFSHHHTLIILHSPIISTTIFYQALHIFESWEKSAAHEWHPCTLNVTQYFLLQSILHSTVLVITIQNVQNLWYWGSFTYSENLTQYYAFIISWFYLLLQTIEFY